MTGRRRSAALVNLLAALGALHLGAALHPAMAERPQEAPCLRAFGAGAVAAPAEDRCLRGAAPAETAPRAALEPASDPRSTGGPRPAEPDGADCALREDCAALDAHPELGPLIAEARALFGVDMSFYRVETGAFHADLPYVLLRQPPFVLRDQAHIPRAYYEALQGLEAHRGAVWSFVIGHEAAHAYQDRIGMLAALDDDAGINSLILVELQADYLGAYFAARHGGVSTPRAEAMLAALQRLPTGQARDRDFHGYYGDRFQSFYMGFFAGVASRDLDLAAATDASLDIVCMVGNVSLPPHRRLREPVCEHAKKRR